MFFYLNIGKYFTSRCNVTFFNVFFFKQINGLLCTAYYYKITMLVNVPKEDHLVACMHLFAVSNVHEQKYHQMLLMCIAYHTIILKLYKFYSRSIKTVKKVNNGIFSERK